MIMHATRAQVRDEEKMDLVLALHQEMLDGDDDMRQMQTLIRRMAARQRRLTGACGRVLGAGMLTAWTDGE